jgi:cell division protein FtsB
MATTVVRFSCLSIRMTFFFRVIRFVPFLMDFSPDHCISASKCLINRFFAPASRYDMLSRFFVYNIDFCLVTNQPCISFIPRSRAGSDPLSGSRSPSPREVDKENTGVIPQTSPFSKNTDKTRSPRRRQTDTSFADEEEVDKIGKWINGIQKSPRMKLDAYAPLMTRPSPQLADAWSHRSFLEQDGKATMDGLSFMQETPYKSFDDSLTDRSFLDSAADPTDVAQAYERFAAFIVLRPFGIGCHLTLFLLRLAVEMEGVKAERHVVSEIKSRLELKLTDLQEETSRLRDENTTLRSRVQQLELGLPGDELEALTHRRSSLSLREQRIYSELQNSTEVIHGLRQHIEELGNQLSEAENTISHQEGLLRLADADIFVSKIKEQDSVILELRCQVKTLESRVEVSKLDKIKWDAEFYTLLNEKATLEMDVKQLQSEIDALEKWRAYALDPSTSDHDLSMYTVDEDSLPSTPMQQMEKDDGSHFHTPYKTPRKRQTPSNASLQQLASSPLAGSDSPIRFGANISPLAPAQPVELPQAQSVPHTPFKSFDEFGTLSPILSLRERISEISTSAVSALAFAPSVEDASSSEQPSSSLAPVSLQRQESQDFDAYQGGDESTTMDERSRVPHSSRSTVTAPRVGAVQQTTSWAHLFVTVALLCFLIATLRSSSRLSDSGDSLTLFDVVRDLLGMTLPGGA